ncbi:MAG TPA: hypothetical protein VN512_11405 [Clostridia bacterium]|nr:hypothetical protein [Clostridia bacterium]
MKTKKFTALAALLLAAFLSVAGCVPSIAPEQMPTPAPVETPVPVTTDVPDETVHFTAMETDTPFSFDVDGDGAAETLLLTEEEDAEAIFETSVFLTVTKGGTEQKLKVTPALFYCAYFMEAGGKTGLAVTGKHENDYMLTNILAFEGANVKELSVADGGIMSAEEGAMVMMDVLHALGTWSVEIEYAMTPDFELVPVEGKEWTIYGCSVPLTVKKELPVEFETDACSYEPETLPVGAQIWLVSGDGKSFMRFSTEDGRIGRLSYKMEGGIATLVDGTPDMDWLDGIVYAG